MSTELLTALILGLLLLQIAIGVAIVRSHDLFGAAMLSGAFSLMGAALFMLLDAADVAFTEASVGAGISTALILAALSLVRFRSRGPRQPKRRLAIVACAAFLLFWLSLVPHMPSLGDPESPLQAHPLTQTYFSGTGTEIGIPNAVTAILGSYRGFDTLGEAFVIFIAGLVVYLLLGRARPGRLESESTAEASDAHR